MDKKIVDLAIVRNKQFETEGAEDAMDWSPEQALGWMKGALAEEKRKVKKMVLCYQLDDGSISHIASGVNRLEAVGIMEVVKNKI